MKKKLNLGLGTCLVVGYLLIISACYKQVPPEGSSGVSADSIISIQSLRRFHTMGMVELLGRPLFIEGVVVANDEHDNWYKSICIQDKTGGIVLP